MSRKRRNPSQKPLPTAAQSFTLPKEDRPVPNRPRPNKWFLAAAILAEAVWLTLLLILAVTG